MDGSLDESQLTTSNKKMKRSSVVLRLAAIGTALVVVLVLAAVKTTSCVRAEEQWQQVEAQTLSSRFYALLAGRRHAEHAEVHPTNSVARADERITCKVFTHELQDRKFDTAIDDRYWFLIRLLNDKGEEVSKTGVGRVFGSKFFDLKRWRDTRMVSSFAQSGGYDPKGEMSGGFIISRTPEELFHIREPGLYTLEIIVQGFERTNGIPQLVRLPPAKLIIRKE